MWVELLSISYIFITLLSEVKRELCGFFFFLWTTKSNRPCQSWKSRDLNVLYTLCTSCRFRSSLHIHSSLPCFVILEWSPVSIALLPARTMVSSSVDGFGETSNEGETFLPGSKMLFYYCSKGEPQPVVCRMPSVLRFSEFWWHSQSAGMVSRTLLPGFQRLSLPPSQYAPIRPSQETFLYLCITFCILNI